MSVDPVFQKLRKSLDASIEALGRDFAKLRTGRANPALLDDIRVEAYGSPMPMNQVANVTVPEARTLRISPFDPGTLGAIEKAIKASDLGLTPNNDGKVIHLNIPPLTEERRKEYVKVAKQYAEECRVSQRSARHAALDEIKKLEKDKKISLDDQKRASDQVQKSIDEYGKKVDAIFQKKEAEILQV